MGLVQPDDVVDLQPLDAGMGSLALGSGLGLTS